MYLLDVTARCLLLPKYSLPGKHLKRFIWSEPRFFPPWWRSGGVTSRRQRVKSSARGGKNGKEMSLCTPKQMSGGCFMRSPVATLPDRIVTNRDSRLACFRSASAYMSGAGSGIAEPDEQGYCICKRSSGSDEIATIPGRA
jgi:hypothetical protein